MKVSDFMHKPLITVGEHEPVRRVVKIIFNLGISGVPVITNKKLVGIVTEEDILKKLFPSIAEFVGDYADARNFFEMEKNLAAIMSRPVREIMNPNPKAVTPQTPLLQAQSLMLVNNFSRVPVVNEKKELVSILSQGDIFRALVGTEVPYEDNDEFRNWLSRHYDLVQTWTKRLSPEIDSLHSLFIKHESQQIYDVIAGTGEHAIALAAKGYTVTGFDRSQRMFAISQHKREDISEKLQSRVTFIHGDYIKKLEERSRTTDAAIFMGNGLPYNPKDWKEILKAASKSLYDNGILVLQIKNFDKIIKNNRLVEFSVVKSKLSSKAEYSFTMFYGAPTDPHDKITATMSVLKYDGKRWMHAGINSMQIANITVTNLKPVLEKLGFLKIQFFGSNHAERLFDKPFDLKKHEWLNVIAQR